MQYRKYYICIIIYKMYYYISNYNKYYTTVLFLINSEVFPSIFFYFMPSARHRLRHQKKQPRNNARDRPQHSERRQIKPKPKAPATRTKKTKLKYFIYAIRLTYIFTNPPPPFLLYKSIYIYNKKPLYL